MQWQLIAGREARYEVSMDGRIRKTKNGAIVGQWKNDQGYMVARLTKPRQIVRVHRLVAAAFVPNPGGKPCVNHIDCDRSNNDYRNLEWCTQAENIAHAATLKRMSSTWAGKRSPAAKLTDEQAANIRRLYKDGTMSMSTLSAQFSASKKSIMNIVLGRTYLPVSHGAKEQS